MEDAGDVDVSAVFSDDSVYDGESESAAFVFGGEEGCEEFLYGFVWDAASGVVHGDEYGGFGVEYGVSVCFGWCEVALVDLDVEGGCWSVFHGVDCVHGEVEEDLV